jgi:hypothetical protein
MEVHCNQDNKSKEERKRKQVQKTKPVLVEQEST